MLLAAAWLLDLATPQLFVAAILLNVPIALSSLALDFRFTYFLVALALVADASAGYANGLSAGGRWNSIALADRAVAGFSFLLVGGLARATQGAAARAGELAGRQERSARERRVRRAVEAIRASVNLELIERAIVREAIEALAIDAAHLYVFRPTLDEPTTYSFATGAADVEVSSERPAAPILSLLHRMAERREALTSVRETDPLGRLLLDTLGETYVVAASIVEHEALFGVLIVAREGVPFEAHFEEGLAYYVDQAAIALAQASLFVQLAQRNEEFANANAALRERGDVIRDIVYALSHDLRTPLSAARMTMQQALAGAYGALPEAYREILGRAMASNEELERLAETLLLVSRYESGERSERREPVALTELANEVVAELEPLWKLKRIAVNVAGDPAAVVNGDERELRRALVNLVANAVAWSPAERHIEIRVAVAENVASVAVDDEGYGVPPSERQGLFERVRDTPSRKGAGSGLGLYLVRRIAESHGGTVAYEPRPGGGSRFTLTLPLAATPVAV